MPTTLPPCPGRHGWPRGKIAHAPCPPPLHKKAARPLPQGRRHPPAQPHLGVFPLCAAAKSEKQREEKQRKKRRRGKEKGSGAPPRRRPGTSGREPRRCREEPRAPLPKSATPLERTLSTPTPRHGRRCGRSRGRLGRRELLCSAAVFIKPASTTPPPLREHAAAP
jgi:hypothetical protein